MITTKEHNYTYSVYAHNKETKQSFYCSGTLYAENDVLAYTYAMDILNDSCSMFNGWRNYNIGIDKIRTNNQ